MNTRNKLLRKARKSNISVDWNNYRRKRNFVNNEIKRAKKAFYKTKLAENENNPDQFCKTIKEIYTTKSKNNTTSKTFKVDGTVDGTYKHCLETNKT